MKNRQIREAAEREINKAITEDEKANALYYQTLRRFIPGESSKPEVRLDSAGLKEIDSAWLKLNDTGKHLRRAYMKLYGAYL
jgi:hypothetical protein